MTPSDSNPTTPSDYTPTPSDYNPTPPSDDNPTPPSDYTPTGFWDYNPTRGWDRTPTPPSDYNPTPPSEYTPTPPADYISTPPSEYNPFDVDFDYALVDPAVGIYVLRHSEDLPHLEQLVKSVLKNGRGNSLNFPLPRHLLIEVVMVGESSVETVKRWAAMMLKYHNSVPRSQAVAPPPQLVSYIFAPQDETVSLREMIQADMEWLRYQLDLPPELRPAPSDQSDGTSSLKSGFGGKSPGYEPPKGIMLCRDWTLFTHRD